MALPVWPASVPATPRRRDFQVSEEANPPITTEFEAGNDRSRPRGTVQHQKQSFSLRLDETQFATFDTFWRTDLAQGTKRFTMPVWMEGAGMVAKTVRMVSRTRPARSGRLIVVAVEIKVEL
ncbi:hypothetical protein [Breoghania sp.]|uniref:hypothetical protein n=1 Tax=Breoghania sp. TaxID=2065378 RepID=UPI002AAB92A9|nr:hypothetical protein [Breoghania sp.]